MNERLNTIEKLISLVGRINNLVASIPSEEGNILLAKIDEFVPLPSSAEDISKEELDNLFDRITQYLDSASIVDENMTNATIDDEKLKNLPKLMEVIRRQMLILGKQVIDHIREFVYSNNLSMLVTGVLGDGERKCYFTLGEDRELEYIDQYDVKRENECIHRIIYFRKKHYREHIKHPKTSREHKNDTELELAYVKDLKYGWNDTTLELSFLSDTGYGISYRRIANYKGLESINPLISEIKYLIENMDKLEYNLEKSNPFKKECIELGIADLVIYYPTIQETLDIWSTQVINAFPEVTFNQICLFREALGTKLVEALNKGISVRLNNRFIHSNYLYAKDTSEPVDNIFLSALKASGIEYLMLDSRRLHEDTNTSYSLEDMEINDPTNCFSWNSKTTKSIMDATDYLAFAITKHAVSNGKTLYGRKMNSIKCLLRNRIMEKMKNGNVYISITKVLDIAFAEWDYEDPSNIMKILDEAICLEKESQYQEEEYIIVGSGYLKIHVKDQLFNSDYKKK